MPPNAYLVYGDDEYQVSAKAAAIVQTLLPEGDRAFGLETLDGRVESADAAVLAMRRCEEALRTAGFLGGRKVVWLQNASFLTDNQIGRADAVKERASRLAAMIRKGLPAGMALVVTAPEVDGRYAFHKAFKEAGAIHEFSAPEKTHEAESQAGRLLGQLLAAAGLRMPPETLDFFLQRVGTDTRHMAGEIEKLAVYLRDRKDVTTADVEAVSCASRNSIAWDLADAFGGRQVARALALLNRLLAQRESPIGLLIVLEHRIRELMLYREALDQGWLVARQGAGGRMSTTWSKVPDEVERQFAEAFEKDPRLTHWYRVGKLAEQAGRFSPAELRRCQRAAAQAHESLVSASSPDAVVLQTLLVRMLS